MKDNLFQKKYTECHIFFKCSEKMVWKDGLIAPGHGSSVTIWKGGIFFPENIVFFPSTENEGGMTLLKKYTEIWYFLFDMFHAPLQKKKKKYT